MNPTENNCLLKQLIATELRSEVVLHIAKVQRELRSVGLAGALIASNPNIYYLTLRFFRGYVWVPAEGEPIWFVMRPPCTEEADVVAIRKPEQISDVLSGRGLMPAEGRIGFENGELTYSEICRLQKVFEPLEPDDCTAALRRARMTKTAWELKQMKIDGALQASVYAKTAELYRPGMTDVELQIALETLLRRKGCLGYSRVSGRLMEINLGSVISGENADVPTPYEFAMGGAGTDPSLPGGADGKEIMAGSTVMVDINGCFNGYQTDMTRTWRVGSVDPLAEKAHECSRTILRELERLAKPGVPVADLYKKAMEIVEAEGLKDYFMGHCQQVAFLGHGVGIELNEQPVVMARSRDVIAVGMTLALEPKFVIPGVGAVGVENTYVVEADGLKMLTKLDESLANLLL